MADNTPVYNLKAVSQETGLNPATLRAWERRYGLVKPKRSSGGHRLYTRQDVELFKWMVERQKEGLSISRAVELWKTYNQPEKSTLPRTPNLLAGTTESMIDELRDQWIAACLAFDDRAASQALQQAFAIAPPETVSMQVLQKGLMLIGERWYEGSATVQQEHFASAIAIRRLNALITSCAAPTRPGSILVACPPGEEHDFILLLVTYLLRRHGWNVLYLGANVPLSNLDATIKATQPSLVLSAAQSLDTAASLREMSEFLVTQDIPLAFGGRIFHLLPDTIKHISGYYLGDDVASVPHIAEILVTAPPAMPHAIPVPAAYAQTMANFIRNEDAIMAFVTTSIPAELIQPAFLEIANINFSRLIVSALSLGDVHLINQSITWLNGLLNNYDLASSGTRNFYASFREAIEHYLGEKGSIILEWLTALEAQGFNQGMNR
ncbi:MAG: MerR family transcriptional regulator [Anaerolineales bacterium]